MGAGHNKQFLNLAGMPLLVHTLKTFQASKQIAEIVIVGSLGDIPVIQKLVEKHCLSKVAAVTQGGAQRQESVFAGVKVLSPTIRRVVVHDGARPLLLLADLEQFLLDSEQDEAVIMAVPVKDTIKTIDNQGWVVATPERELLRAVQTPQVFDRALLEQAHEYAATQGFIGTDDAALVEHLGRPVRVVTGSWDNIKITTPEDLLVAEQILRKRSMPKVE